MAVQSTELNKKQINEIIDFGSYCEMKIYDRYGKLRTITKLDKEDINKVNQYRWYIDKRNHPKTDYIRAYVNNKKLYLHQFIFGKKKGFVIDHINQNGLDNRKENLRFATPSQNNWNRKCDGITFRKDTKKWQAQICINYKNINLGSFKNKIDALKTRKIAEKFYFKEFCSI